MINKSKALQVLEANESATPSQFEVRARERRLNATWMKWSREFALQIIEYMEENNLSRADVAQKLGVSPQYVSRILSGKINFSFKSVAEIEDGLGFECVNFGTRIPRGVRTEVYA